MTGQSSLQRLVFLVTQRSSRGRTLRDETKNGRKETKVKAANGKTDTSKNYAWNVSGSQVIAAACNNNL